MGHTHATAADVMSSNVVSVRADMTLDELATFLTDHQISGAPVLDGHGRLVGVVSQTDIAEAEGLRGRPEEEAEAVVGDIMTPTAYTVPHDTPVADLARTMVAGRVHRLLVTRDGHVVGIVTSLDLLRVLYEAPADSGPPR